MKENPNKIYDNFKVGVALLATLIFIYVLYISRTLFLSALIGVGIAGIMHPILTKLQKKFGVSRLIGAVSIVSLFLGLSAVLSLSIGSVVLEQLDSLYEKFPSIVDSWERRWAALSEQYPSFAKALQKTQPAGIAKTTVGMFVIVVDNVTEVLSGLTVGAVIALFTSINAEYYHSGLLNLFSSERKNQLKQKLKIIGQTLNKWFRAQLLDMLCVAILTAFGLWVCGIDYWVVFGFLAGALTIVPFVGVIVTLAFATIVVVTLQPDKIFLLWFVFLFTQQLEGNFILPKLMKDHVQTPSAVLVFLMLLSGAWLGVLGIVVTPPLLAIGIALYNNSNIYQTE